MRRELPPWVERARVVDGHFGTPAGSGPQGVFRLPGPRGMTLDAFADDGRDWHKAGLDGEPWEHVSVSLKPRAGRCPSWDELEFVKHAFWNDDEWAMQLHAPPADHINTHPHTLHLWRPTATPIPTPPKACV